MKSLSNVRNVVSLTGTALVFTAVLSVVALQSSPDTSSSKFRNHDTVWMQRDSGRSL